MTIPVFLETDETAFDTDRALTAEHGRRIIRNALAIYNERCGHVGYSERLVGPNGSALSTRVIMTVDWAYHGPINYYCPAPVGQKNKARAEPFVRLLLTGRATGLAFTQIYAINASLVAPTESQMLSTLLTSPAAAEVNTADWEVTLEVPVRPGWNKIWIAFRCGQYGAIENLTKTIDGVDYPPFLCSLNNENTMTCSHPALLATQVDVESAPAYAIRISTIVANMPFLNQTYTCCLAHYNPDKSVTLDDGVYYLWEGFRNELEQIGAIYNSNTRGVWAPDGVVFPVYAERRNLDVINLDSLMVDGSQVWQLEDNDGAGLRWWQLPSALQYRQAANLAESARRAVCPMVSVGGEVTRPVTPIPYPLGGGPKPYGWVVSESINRGTQYALLSLDSLPPFHLPTDTVILEYCFDMCLIAAARSDRINCTITAGFTNFATGATIATATNDYELLPLDLSSGSLNGFSILSRTISYAIAYSKTPNSRCDYGQEGLTVRGDFHHWQEIRGTVTILRSLLPAAPVTFSVLPLLNIPAGDQKLFYTAQSQLSVRIAGK